MRTSVVSAMPAPPPKQMPRIMAIVGLAAPASAAWAASPTAS